MMNIVERGSTEGRLIFLSVIDADKSPSKSSVGLSKSLYSCQDAPEDSKIIDFPVSWTVLLTRVIRYKGSRATIQEPALSTARMATIASLDFSKPNLITESCLAPLLIKYFASLSDRETSSNTYNCYPTHKLPYCSPYYN